MKSVTEFAGFTLKQALTSKTALTAEGKTPEEIQAGLGTSFKFEGDKLKHFINAIDIAEKNLENLRRVLVVTFAEGEAVPAKASKVEEHYYMPESLVVPFVKPPAAKGKGGRGGGGRGGGGGGDRRGPPKDKNAKGTKGAAPAPAAKAESKSN